jgi:hypothetical protein
MKMAGNFFDQFDAPPPTNTSAAAPASSSGGSGATSSATNGAPGASPPSGGNFFDQFDGLPSTAANADSMRTPGGLYHYIDPTTGGETFSKLEPPAGAKPFTGYSPADASTGDNFTAGVGKSLVDTGRGLFQLGASIGHARAIGLVSDDTMARVQADVDAAHQRDAPLMNTTAGTVGDITGQAAQFALLPEGGLVKAAAAGAAIGAAQPVVAGETRTGNALTGATGGAIGNVAGRVVSSVVKPVTNALSDAGQAAVDKLTAEGIPLSLSQRTGSQMARHVERASAMAGGDAADELTQAQRNAVNNAVLRRIGVTDPNVGAATPDVLSDARDAITGVMDDVASRSNTKLDGQLQGEITRIQGAMPRTLQASKQAPLQANIDDIMANAKANGGKLDGQFVQRLNSTLGDLSGDPELAPLAGQLREAVASATGRGASPEDQAALTLARQQYRALKQIEPAVDPATGNISVLKLMSSLSNKANRNQALYGAGDQSLMDFARAAKQILPDTIRNSGTAERALPTLSAVETLGSGEPVKAGIKLAAGALGLKVAGKATRSQGSVGKYLANGMPGVGTSLPANIKTAATAAGYGTAESARQPAVTSVQQLFNGSQGGGSQ